MDGFPCPLDLDGLSLWYDRESPSFTVRGLAMGTYERSTAALFGNVVGPGMTVLDVGAHIGYFSLLAATRVGPTGRVWSFEPDPRNRDLLKRNVEANGFGDRIHVVPKAIGATEGETKLYRYQADSGSSSLFSRQATITDTVPIHATTLDRWAELEGWPAVDFVKMDVEGAEWTALAGMAELNRRNPALALVVEFNAEALEEAGVVSESFFRMLGDSGFERISLIDDAGLQPVSDARAMAAVTRKSRWVAVNLYCQKATYPSTAP